MYTVVTHWGDLSGHSGHKFLYNVHIHIYIYIFRSLEMNIWIFRIATENRSDEIRQPKHRDYCFIVCNVIHQVRGHRCAECTRCIRQNNGTPQTVLFKFSQSKFVFQVWKIPRVIRKQLSDTFQFRGRAQLSAEYTRVCEIIASTLNTRNKKSLFNPSRPGFECGVLHFWCHIFHFMVVCRE